MNRRWEAGYIRPMQSPSAHSKTIANPPPTSSAQMNGIRFGCVSRAYRGVVSLRRATAASGAPSYAAVGAPANLTKYRLPPCSTPKQILPESCASKILNTLPYRLRKPKSKGAFSRYGMPSMQNSSISCLHSRPHPAIRDRSSIVQAFRTPFKPYGAKAKKAGAPSARPFPG